eukprot:maker-scaffold613_size124221-snap-gene-0.28 protein:Tk11738 transcript:maker-scaffold613_size124221-snap-gene-0.28-mRNA-1 annotation:"alpha- -mannosyl-glycoprotein 4-beta-n-acetylglucosaminyltransferase c"
MLPPPAVMVWLLRRVRLHPFVYLFFLLTVLSLMNVFLQRGGFIKPPTSSNTGRKQVQMKLMEGAEATILARIKYPDRPSALLYGTPPTKRFKMMIGLTSAQRKNVSYVETTLQSMFNSTSVSELGSIHVVLCLVDTNRSVIHERAAQVAGRFETEIGMGLLEIIAPPANIYPSLNYQTMVRTYKNSARETEWRSKLALDFSFLFAYCNNELSEYFLNMEDDVVPVVPNFIQATYQFIDEKHNQMDALRDDEAIRRKRKKLLRILNPGAKLSTTMESYEEFKLDNAYDPLSGSYFWARGVKINDSITLQFKQRLHGGILEIISGFGPEENRPTSDRMLQASLWISSLKPKARCLDFKPAATLSSRDGGFRFDTKGKTWCLKIQVRQLATDWLVVKHINILPIPLRSKPKSPIPSQFTTPKPSMLQGSILGPILYLVLVADMPDCVGIGDEDNSCYADDPSIWAIA